MIRSPRRSAGRSRVALAALVTTGGVVLAGCAAGQQTQTARQFSTVDGGNGGVGSIALRDVSIQYPESGRYPEGGDAPLRLVVVNSGDSTDTLTEVRTDAAGSVSFGTGSGTPTPDVSAGGTPSETPTGTPTDAPTGTPGGTPAPTETGPPAPTSLAIPPNVAVTVGAGGPGTSIVLTGLTRELRPSAVVSITFVFQTAGTVTIQAPVAVPLQEVEPAPTISAGGEE